MPLYWLTGYTAAICAFEYANCIMYIQDFITFNDFCLIMCIVPLLISMATLVQFSYFVTLIRNRLQLLGDLLKGARQQQQCLWKNVNYPVAEVEDGGRGVVSKKLDMRVIEELYGKLNAAFRLLGSVFGIQLMVMLTTLFITLTTLSYYLCIQGIR